jgi:hypothetical protein
MKNFFILICFLFSLLSVNAQKRLKESPSDILNSRVGLVITVPMHHDFNKLKNGLIDELTAMGFKIFTVDRWDYFSFNANQISESMKENKVKYVLQYCEMSGFKMFTIYSFSNNATIQDRTKDYTHVQSYRESSANDELKKSLKKADLSSGDQDPAIVHTLKMDARVPEIYSGYPKDLDTSNLLVIKYIGMGAGKIQKEMYEIFNEYPYKKDFTVYDSVEYRKNQGQRYLLSMESNTEYLNVTTYQGIKVIDTHTEPVQQFLPVVRDLQTGKIYIAKGVTSYGYPDIYKKFVQAVKSGK